MIEDQTPATGGATTRRESALSGWRLSAVAIVALLAVAIGAALGAYLVNGRGSGGFGDAAAYVPSDAPMYIELHTEPSAEQDAALREILARFPDIPNVDLDRPLSPQIAEQLEELLGLSGTEISWTADVEPWFDGTVGIAMTEVPATAGADPMAMPEAPGMLLLLGVTDRPAAEAALQRIVSEAGVTTTTTSEHAGFTVVEAEGQGAYAVTEDQLVLAASADDVRAALDASSGGSGLSSGVMAELAAGLPGDTLAMGASDGSAFMMDSIEQMRMMSPELAAAFDALYADMPSRTAFAVSAEGDRLVLDTVGEAPRGPFAMTNAERGLADEVPAEALVYADSGNAGPALAAIVGAVKEAAAADPSMAEGLSTAEAALGADLEELVSWIGDVAVVAGMRGDAPYGGLLIVPTDAETAERRLGQLGSFAGLAAMDPSSGITVETETVGETTVTRITWAGAVPDAAPPIPGGIAVEYAVTDDRAMVGVGDGFVAAMLEVDPSASLAATSRFADALAGVGGANNAGTVWVDLAGIRTAVEGALLTDAAMADEYEASIQGWVEPFDALVGVSRVEGERVVQQAALTFD